MNTITDELDSFEEIFNQKNQARLKSIIDEM